MGVDLDGAKDVLGMWLGAGDEGAKYWPGVLTEIRNRGVEESGCGGAVLRSSEVVGDSGEYLDS